MSFIGITSRMRITSTAVEELISGNVPIGIGGRLKVTTSSLQKFVDGGTSIGFASVIGCTSSNLQELRNAIGHEGPIGLLIGLCIQRKKG